MECKSDEHNCNILLLISSKFRLCQRIELEEMKIVYYDLILD